MCTNLMTRRHLLAGMTGATALAAGVAARPNRAMAVSWGMRRQWVMASGADTRRLREMAQESSPEASPLAQPDMHGAIYPFQIGKFACHAVSDGASSSPMGEIFLFAQTPPKRAGEVLAETRIDPASVVIHHTSVLVDTGENLVLVDTGYGPDVSPNDGLLLGNLQEAGIAPEDIDVVVITHGHPDHIGGNLDAEGKPIFTNARYVISQEDWDFWSDRPRVEESMSYAPDFAQLLLGFVERQLLPLEGSIDLIGYDEEVVPGITSIAAQGHTPGHMALKVTSGDEGLWIVGDIGFGQIHLAYPDLVGLPDVEPERMVETRLRLFDQLAKDGGLVSFYHDDPFPGLGHVAANGDVWAWEEITT